MARGADRRSLALLLVVAGCGMLPPPVPSVALPGDAFEGAGDPMRSALTNVSSAFAAPDRLAGRPALAARAVAQMEYVAAELPIDPRFTNLNPTVPAQLANARQEWRAALGIAAAAPPQAVITAYYRAARALENGAPASVAAASLPPELFAAGGAAALARLDAFPALPITNAAAVAAADALRSRDGPSGRSL